MRRVPPWMVSIAAHAAVVALWLAVRAEAPTERAARDGVVELIDVIAPPVVAEAKAEAPAGGGQPQSRSLPAVRPRQAKPRVEPRVKVEADADAEAEAEAETETGAETGIETGTATGTGNGNGTGDGNGMGRGNGNGTGTGTGVETEPPVMAFERMVAAPRSKARPPVLIYPKRNREEDPASLFIAVLKIDAEGYVVGAELKSAPSGRPADRAMSAVFRFAYDPALDDDGKPIAAVVEQRFMVE